MSLMSRMRLLPDIVVTMQILLFDTRSNVQGRCRRENSISSQLCAILRVVRPRYSAQEMVDDPKQL